jgi:hypothetical protein
VCVFARARADFFWGGDERSASLPFFKKLRREILFKFTTVRENSRVRVTCSNR